MTIVVWDGKTLAADRRVSSDITIDALMEKHTTITKVYDLRQVKRGRDFVEKSLTDEMVWNRVIAIGYSGTDKHVRAFHAFLLDVLKHKEDVEEDIRNWIKFTPAYLELNFILVVQNSKNNNYGICTIKKHTANLNHKPFFTYISEDFYAIGSGAGIVNQWHKHGCELTATESVYLAALHTDSCGDGYTTLNIRTSKIKQSKTYSTGLKAKFLDLFQQKILHC